MTTLTDKAMLVQLTVHNWTARKYDRDISDEVADIHGATADSGRYNKLLLPKKALAGVQSASNALRDHHETNTLPWTLTGVGLLPGANYFTYMGEHRRLKILFEKARDDLLAGYEAAKEEAKNNLADLYREEDYPTAEQLARRIGCDINIMPLPDASDFRVTLGDVEEARIRAEIEASVNAAVDAAVRSLWQRVHDTVARMAMRLEKFERDPTTGNVTHPFRDSLVGNLRELVDLLPRLNMSSDPALERMTERLRASLCAQEPDDLRNDDTLRQAHIRECRSVLDIMQAYTGAPVALPAAAE